MTDLATTLAKLARRNTMPNRPFDTADDSGRLHDFDLGEQNPGQLRARIFVPANLKPGSALVVVLHGCTQTAADYDEGSGWSRLAEAAGFALLFPEQQPTNNQNRCFNWFSPVDQRRGAGEAQSIRTMVAAMVAAHGIDEGRIYITGLSAGGAMAVTMLATYPEVFAGGAIIAGLPFGSARNVADAFARMRGDGHPAPAELASLVRSASSHAGPWPKVSIWQGSADLVVHPSNADQIVGQWLAIHGVDARSPEYARVDGASRRRWHGRDGQPVVESWTIDGMGHGTPVTTRGNDACGIAGPYMLEAGISSTRHIARGWGIAVPAQASAEVPPVSQDRPQVTRLRPMAPPDRPVKPSTPGSVRTIIEDALRAAGLMR